MKDHWVGALALIIVLLLAGGLMSINHNKYEELTDNFSDNKSDNMSDKLNLTRKTSAEYCWVERTTKYSNRSVREKVKCSSIQNSNATNQVHH